MRLPLLTALLLTACNPAVDALPLDLPDCSPEDSPTELARFPYDPDAPGSSEFGLDRVDQHEQADVPERHEPVR